VSAAGAWAELPAGSRLALGFLDAEGRKRIVPLEQCRDVAFEETAAMRAFRWSRGLGHFPGWWWAATTERHVGYESWLERDHIQALDFDWLTSYDQNLGSLAI
jgi:hypothetical protein